MLPNHLSRQQLTPSKATRQCQSSTTGSRTFSRSRWVSPHIVCRWEPTCRSHVLVVSLHDVEHVLVFGLVLHEDVQHKHLGPLGHLLGVLVLDVFGTSLAKGARVGGCWTRTRLTKVTRFDLTWAMSSLEGRKKSGGTSARLHPLPVRGSSGAGVRLLAASMLKMCSIFPWWSDCKSRTFRFLSTLSPQNFSTCPFSIHFLSAQCEAVRLLRPVAGWQGSWRTSSGG